MAEPTLEGCREKWARGAALANNLVEKLREYETADPPPYKLDGGWFTDRREYVWTGEIVRPMEDALMWAVILGDVVHNWRSALDHLVWQLVALDAEKDGSTDHQFPIASSGGAYWSRTKDGQDSLRTRRLRHISDRHKIMIDRLQPYRTNEPGKLESLEALRDMSNHDKHRLLHTMLLAVDARPEQGFRFVPNADAGEWVKSKTGFLDPAGPTEVLVATFNCPGENPVVTCPEPPRLVVGVDPLRMRLSDLPEIGEAVLDLIESFAEDFPEG